MPKYCQFDWFIRLGLLIILHFDFIILPRFELWLFAECFTNVIILFPSLTSDSDIFDYKLILLSGITVIMDYTIKI